MGGSILWLASVVGSEPASNLMGPQTLLHKYKLRIYQLQPEAETKCTSAYGISSFQNCLFLLQANIHVFHKTIRMLRKLSLRDKINENYDDVIKGIKLID